VKLADLIGQDGQYDARFATRDIAGVAADSRKVRPDHLFVAVPGTKADGLSYLPQALAAGAAAIMAERAPAALPDGIAFVRVDNVRRALALAAARFYPRQPATIAAVTGTSGKTSVAAFTRQIWASLGCEAASIGTIGLVTPREEIYGSLTTPDPIELARTLDRLAEDGITHLAMEASSHGLDQHRIDGVRVTVGGFTNLSRDHMDYHATVEAYLAAKLILFERIVVADGAAVVAADNPHADAVIAAAAGRGLRVIGVGRTGSGIRLLGADIDGFSQTLRLEHDGKAYRVRLPLVGAFQVENALVAAGMAIATGSEAAAVFAALEGLEGAKGRLELIGQRNGAPIFVDYAHKPDALEKALEALRPYVTRKLIVVFGAGGDRDRDKRPLMGQVARELADTVVVTNDNPRSEEPIEIAEAILQGAGTDVEVDLDRRSAIESAIAAAGPGDVVVIAGKGHEQGQEVAGVVHPFDDREVAREALRARGVARG
jgi:UDP-N-acetylmuramoyl-L-alanyl-D-glutamate--2,6-diaminopimelate ligase